MVSNILKAIVEVLKRTKEDSESITSDSLELDTLRQAGIFSKSETIKIDRTKRIALAKKAIEHGASLGEIVEFLTWKDFEGFVAAILTAHNYECVESFRRRGNSVMQGMEIDVIGIKGNTLVAIDAKMWGVRRGKVSALKTAAEKQRKRTSELSNDLHKLAKKLNNLQAREYQLFPVIVTWLVEDVELHEGVPVVPIFKLNSFIQDLYKYEDLIAVSSGCYSSSL